MGLFDKFKNLFTEEIDEEPIVKKERHIEVAAPTTRVEREQRKEEEKVQEEPVKEDRFVFFSDDDFKDLEKPKKEVKKKETVLPYRGATVNSTVEEKKVFKPTPIISPVYGILDKNYSKDEIMPKKVTTKNYRTDKPLSLDDVRNKAYGTIEDDLQDTLLGKVEYIEEEQIEEFNDIDIFEELEKYDQLDKLEESINAKNVDKSDDIDNLFGVLDTKKDEILDELDIKKDEILDELDTKKGSILIENDIEDLGLDEETLELSKQLESQKRKLDELNDFIEEDSSEETEEIISKEDELNESELFDLIDSMYEKRDEE